MPMREERRWSTLGGVVVPLGVAAGACLMATTGVLLFPDGGHSTKAAQVTEATEPVEFDNAQPPQGAATSAAQSGSPTPSATASDAVPPSGSPSPSPVATNTNLPLGTPSTTTGGTLVVNVPAAAPQLPSSVPQPQVPAPVPSVPQQQTSTPPAPAQPSDIRINLVETSQGSGTLTLTNTASGTMTSWSLWVRLGGNGWFRSLTGDATTSFNQGTATAQSRNPLGPNASLQMQWQITGDAGTIACTLNGATCTVEAAILPPG